MERRRPVSEPPHTGTVAVTDLAVKCRSVHYSSRMQTAKVPAAAEPAAADPGPPWSRLRRAGTFGAGAVSSLRASPARLPQTRAPDTASPQTRRRRSAAVSRAASHGLGSPARRLHRPPACVRLTSSSGAAAQAAREAWRRGRSAQPPRRT